MIITKFLKNQLLKTLKRETNKSDPNSLTTIWALLISLIGFLIAHLAYNNFTSLPKVRTKNNLHNSRFLVPRALNEIENIIQYGPRVTGSVTNEEKIVNHLLMTINELIHFKSANKLLVFDHQTSDGAFIRNGQTYLYSGIQNVVAKFYTRNEFDPEKEPESFILLSTNFDGFSENLGICDNGFGVAMLLEVLRILSQSNDSFQHGIILLWNGAKNSGLQGSHSFVTQHKWMSKIKAFISVNTMACSLKEIVGGIDEKSSWMMNVRYLFLL